MNKARDILARADQDGVGIDAEDTQQVVKAFKPLTQFVETIAKTTMREEVPEWESEETGISDSNQDLTLGQADWADALIEEARRLLGVEPAPKSSYVPGSGFMPIADAVEIVLQLARDNICASSKEELDRQTTACAVLEDFATNHLGD